MPNSETRRSRSTLPPFLALVLGAGAGPLLGCGATPERVPTPEFLDLSPQSLSVAEPYGGGDELELRAGAEFRSQLRELGYRVVAPGEAGDAELRYYLERSETGRTWYTGSQSATVELSAELHSPLGILWRNAGSGRGFDDEEDDDRDDAFDIVFGMALDSMEDSLFEPDYSEQVKEAVHDAVHAALRSFPKRPVPKTPAPATP